MNEDTNDCLNANKTNNIKFMLGIKKEVFYWSLIILLVIIREVQYNGCKTPYILK